MTFLEPLSWTKRRLSMYFGFSTSLGNFWCLKRPSKTEAWGCAGEGSTFLSSGVVAFGIVEFVGSCSGGCEEGLQFRRSFTSLSSGFNENHSGLILNSPNFLLKRLAAT